MQVLANSGLCPILTYNGVACDITVMINIMLMTCYVVATKTKYVTTCTQQYFDNFRKQTLRFTQIS